MSELIFLIIGISGVLAIATNFLLELLQKISKKTFAWINLYGCVSLFLYSYYDRVWVFIILNTFLIITGIYGLYQIYKK